MSAIDERRAEARRAAIAARLALGESGRAEASAAICARLAAHPAWAAAQAVAIFWSTAEEVDVRPLLGLAIAAGKRVALPRVVARGAPLAMHWVEASPEVRSRFGVLEPAASAPLAALPDLDLVVVPALRVDERGARLGYGGGFYDRTLPSCARAERVGVCFEALVVPDLDPAPWDAPLHRLITEACERDFGARGRSG